MMACLDKIARTKAYAGRPYKQITAHTVVECELNLDQSGDT